jgi:hypothetical protein
VLTIRASVYDAVHHDELRTGDRAAVTVDRSSVTSLLRRVL